jgi:hypothetical protein
MGLRGSFNLSNSGAGPWAHLVIAWPHGVPVVDAMVDAFFKVPNMTVVSLNNTYMRPSAMSTINCVYAAEMEHPSKRRHILRKTAYIARMTSKAIVTMVLVDTQPTPEPLNNGVYRTHANTRVVAIKRALRAKYNPAGTQQHVLHVTDNPSENAAILQCLGMPPPDPPTVDRAIAERTEPREYHPRAHGGLVESTFMKGLRALNSPGCMIRGVPSMSSARAVVIKGDAATWPKGSIEYSDVDVLVANLSGARACLTAHLNRTRVIAVPPLQLHFDVLVPGGSNILVRFDLYGQLYFPRAALDPAWMEALRLRSVWALSPLGFAYRRQAFVDECAVRLLEWRAFLGTTKAKRKEKHRHWIDEHGCEGRYTAYNASSGALYMQHEVGDGPPPSGPVMRISAELEVAAKELERKGQMAASTPMAGTQARRAAASPQQRADQRSLSSPPAFTAYMPRASGTVTSQRSTSTVPAGADGDPNGVAAAVVIWQHAFQSKELVFSAIRETNGLHVITVHLLSGTSMANAAHSLGKRSGVTASSLANSSHSSLGVGVCILLWQAGNHATRLAAESLEGGRQLAGLAERACVKLRSATPSNSHGAPRCAFVAGLDQQLTTGLTTEPLIYPAEDAVAVVSGAALPPLLRAVGIGEPGSYLSRHTIYEIPYYLSISSRYTIRWVTASQLFMKCAVSVGSCRQKHMCVLTSTPHYGFAKGTDEQTYGHYYHTAFLKGAERSDHTLTSFRHLRASFNASLYPKCVADPFNRMHISMIVVHSMANGSGTIPLEDGVYRIRDGVHRAALLAAENINRSFPVLVLDIGPPPAQAPTLCARARGAEGLAAATLAAASSPLASSLPLAHTLSPSATASFTDSRPDVSQPLSPGLTRVLQAINTAQLRCAQRPECVPANISPVVMFTPKGGLGNSMLGLASAQLLAALLCRRFLVRWSDREDKQMGASYQNLFEPLPGVIGTSSEGAVETHRTLGNFSATVGNDSNTKANLYTHLDFTQNVKAFNTHMKLQMLQENPNHFPIAHVRANMYFASILAARYPHVARQVALGHHSVPARRHTCVSGDMQLLVENRLAFQAREVTSREGVSSEVRTLTETPPPEAFFGLLSRHTLTPHRWMAQGAATDANGLRAQAGGGGVALIGLVVRGMLLEGRISDINRNVTKATLLADSGLLRCVKKARHAAALGGANGSKVYIAADWAEIFHRELKRHLGDETVLPQIPLIHTESHTMKGSTRRGKVALVDALKELLLLARLDALVVWDLSYSTYGAVATSWFQHGGGGQLAHGPHAAPRHKKQRWRAVYQAAQGCTPLEPWQVEPPVRAESWLGR